MNLKESINSDDIEIAELAANLLLKEIGIEKVIELLKDYDKYDCDFIDGYIYLIGRLENIIINWNKQKFVNTPLLNMTEIKNNVIYTNGNDFTFDMPYKLEEDGK
jgi:hypothetical protein